MTDKLPPLSTQIVPPSHTSHSLLAAVIPQYVARKQETVEEEPYTIKCICGFADDDGNTIYCEKCDTWQHIECYYPNNVEDAIREDFNHSCADCEPRTLDRQQAIERQRARTSVVPLVEEEAIDKKTTKRPPAKSHKKKPKPTDLHMNGHHGSIESTGKHSIPHDASNPHPPKKTKNSHKPSQSISSQAPKRSPSHGRPNHGHPPSPATTPPDLPDDIDLHGYSSRFASHFNDQGVRIVNVNSYAGLQVSNTMLEWTRDPARMEKEAGVAWREVFQKLPADMGSRKVTPEVEHVKKTIAPSGITVYWQALRSPSAIGKDVPLMELNGQIGFQATYCQDPHNKWEDFTGPLPFVLFHPYLPLYIDTRKEGSEARFVRRSCRPNAALETYLSDGMEYHFWLVSDRPIAAKEQITIPWDFRFPKHDGARMLRILGLSDEETNGLPEPVVDDAEYQRIAGWVRLILTEHGGCACSLGNDCAFARFHRAFSTKTQTRATAPKSRKKRLKPQHAISPTSTGHATNSRAASEGHNDDVLEHEGRSVSGSSRSKPGSRDMTPTARQGSFDQLGILTEPTDRDKRKVTMIEDSFRRMEQQLEHKTAPPRKRKRVSDGTGTNRPKSTKSNSGAPTPTLPNGFSERQYVDAGTTRSKSGSPASAESPSHSHPSRKVGLGIESVELLSIAASVAAHPSYRDAAVQTEPERRHSSSPQPNHETPRRRHVSLTQRLLASRHRMRQEDEEKRKQLSLEQQVSSGAMLGAMEVDSPIGAKTPMVLPKLEKEADKVTPPRVVAVTNSVDWPMPDVSPVSPTDLRPNGVLPSPAPTTTQLKTRSPDLRVQMPPVPAFGSPTVTSAPSSATTPLSAGASLAQSPFSATGFPGSLGLGTPNGGAPKKKLSLSDYTKRMNKGATRPSVGTAMLKPIPNSEEPKSATSIDNGGLIESPTADKLHEMTNPVPVSATVTAATNESV